MGIFDAAFAEADRLSALRKPAIIAIDGRCGSGKTTLAGYMFERFGCPVMHTDDFYLPFSARVDGWQNIPCANMDISRLRTEVVQPASGGFSVRYRAYSCSEGRYLSERLIDTGGLAIVEGSYSLHPALREFYALRLFLTCSPEVQRLRLALREGERASSFERIWIPLEERYFADYSVPESADIIIET